MDGLLLVDKPAGWTSHDAVAYVRKALGEKKAGHTGTLDPDATGLLIVLLGKATRLARYFEDDGKGYRAVMRLGIETDTEDASGSVIRECPVPGLSKEDIEAAFRRFTGEISQVPPMYSAVKVGGRPLYKSARAGKDVERSPRTAFINEIALEEMALPFIGFRAACSKGTYIRTLCRELGEAMGSCAHMHSLRRTASGRYDVEGAVSIADKPAGEALERNIIPLSGMLQGMASAAVTERAAAGIKNGRAPEGGEITSVTERAAPGSPVRLVDGAGNLLAVGRTAGSAEGTPGIKLEVVII